MYAMACFQRELWKLFYPFAIRNKQYVPTEDRKHPVTWLWAVTNVFRNGQGNLESFNETKWPPLLAFQTTEEIKLYNKLVNVLCTEMKSGYFDCDMCYQLGIRCNLSAVPDPERGCQSIECSWMGDIYFDFSKPPKEKTNIREEIGIFQTYILLKCSILCQQVVLLGGEMAKTLIPRPSREPQEKKTQASPLL